jgi:hypothetical protein
MSFIDRILAQGGRRKELDERLGGKNSLANAEFNRARAAASGVAATTAARAGDSGMNAAAANRLASQGEQSAVAQAAQQHAAGRAGEVQRAEDELAMMRDRRGAFGRQLFGAGLGAASKIGTMLGIGGDQGQQSQGAAQGALGAAGMAAGGPLGAMGAQAAGGFASQLFGGGGPFGGAAPTNDQLLAASPQPSAPVAEPSGFAQALQQAQAAPAPQGIAGQLTAATMPAGGVPPGMTPEQYAEWLRQQNGGF